MRRRRWGSETEEGFRVHGFRVQGWLRGSRVRFRVLAFGWLASSKREAGSGKREAGSGKREAGSGKREASTRMTTNFETAWLADVRLQFEKMKRLTESALAQVTDDQLNV